jgi:hypothetical protein
MFALSCLRALRGLHVSVSLSLTRWRGAVA